MLAILAAMPEEAKYQTIPQRRLADLIYRTLTARDPEILLGNPKRNGMWQGMAKYAIQRLAISDFDQALAWVEEFAFESSSPYFSKDHFLAGLVPVASRVAPERLIGLLDSLQTHDEWPSALKEACQSSMSEEARTVLTEYLDGRENANLRLQGRCALARSILWSEGFGPAVSYLQDLLPTEDVASGISMLAKNYDAGNSPSENAEWIYDHLEHVEKFDILTKYIEEWMQYDIQGAGEWLGKRRDDPGARPVIEDFIKRIREIAPQSAEIWASELSAGG